MRVHTPARASRRCALRRTCGSPIRREAAGSTLFPACNSWYVGANVEGKPRRVLPYTGGFSAYVEKCDAIVANEYEGFSLSAG